MLKELYIHIGTPKTGTSAITSYLNFNVDNLKKQNTTYLENINNGEVILPLWGDDSEEKTKSINKILVACLECKTEKAILSSEIFSFALNSITCKEALLFIFKALSLKNIKIKISVVIRGPAKYMLAAYKEDVTSGLCPLSFFGWLKTDQGAEHSNIIQYARKWGMLDNIDLAIYQYNENKKNITFTKSIFERAFGINTEYFGHAAEKLLERASFRVSEVEAIRRINATTISFWNRPVWKYNQREVWEKILSTKRRNFKELPNLSASMRFRRSDKASLSSCLQRMFHEYEQVPWSGDDNTGELISYREATKQLLLELSYEENYVVKLIEDIKSDELINPPKEN